MHGHERAGDEQQEDDGAPLPALKGKYVQADGQDNEQLCNREQAHGRLPRRALSAIRRSYRLIRWTWACPVSRSTLPLPAAWAPGRCT